jgi:hypothetical protein
MTLLRWIVIFTALGPLACGLPLCHELVGSSHADGKLILTKEDGSEVAREMTAAFFTTCKTVKADQCLVVDEIAFIVELAMPSDLGTHRLEDLGALECPGYSATPDECTALRGTIDVTAFTARKDDESAAEGRFEGTMVVIGPPVTGSVALSWEQHSEHAQCGSGGCDCRGVMGGE